MHPLITLLTVAVPFVAPPSSAQDHPLEQPDPFVVAYHEACADGNVERLADHWRSAPGRVLVTIDADLEGSLALREEVRGAEATEEQRSAVESQVSELHGRALFAARVAAEALDRPLILDYAASFCGWDEDQRGAFRAGQQKYREASRALGSGELEAALAAALECVELAEPLGDAWGTAMGLSLAARLQAEDGRHEQALVLAGRARLLHRGLGLRGGELQDLHTIAASSLALDRRARALAAARLGVSMSEDDPRWTEAFSTIVETLEGNRQAPAGDR